MAHLSLAQCYTHGKGVKQSYEEAFHHHLVASETGKICLYTHTYTHTHTTGCITTYSVCAGNPLALYNVGGHYFAGKGVGLSFQKAAEFYRKAAEVGFTPAQVGNTMDGDSR